MTLYTVTNASREEAVFVDQQIVAYNQSQVPFSQDKPFIGVYRVVKDDQGKVLGGLNALIYCWKCLSIDVLWVDQASRGLDIGTSLLKAVEDYARDQGCRISHLDTFDFQAKDFYIKQGYQVVGQIDNCPEGHTRYYMSKVLD